MGRKIGILSLVSLFLLPCVGEASSLKKLSKKLSKKMKVASAYNLAVLPFPYHNGHLSSGSSILAERITTQLVQDGVPVVERNLMKKILEEQHLQQSGVVKNNSAQGVGSVLGVDAILTGTLIDMNKKRTELNARLIDAESGEVLMAQKVVVARTWRDRPRPVKVKKKPVQKARYKRPKPDPDFVDPEDEITELDPEERPTLEHHATQDGTIHLSNYDFPKDSYTEMTRLEEERQRELEVEAAQEKDLVEQTVQSLASDWVATGSMDDVLKDVLVALNAFKSDLTPNTTK